MAGGASANAAVDRVTADYSASYYKEDPIRPGDEAPGGTRDRYEIYMHQLNAKAPVSAFKNVDTDVNVVFESMAGATPYYIEPDPSTGKPLQVMTGPTVEDQRTDVSLALNRYLEDGRMTLAGGVSSEDDYLAGSFGFDMEKSVAGKNTTLLTGFAASFDTITPTDSALYPMRVKKADKQTYSLFAGLAQVVNKNAAVQLSLSYKRANGFLSDPYKEVYVAGQRLADSRPGERNQLSLMARYRHHFAPVWGTLHADYRFYLDDWDIQSHTVEAAWHQSLWILRIVPSVRYYSQSAANFYAAYFILTPADGLHSSDYRLAPYGSIAYGLKFDMDPQPLWNVDWRAAFSYQRYISNDDFALGQVQVRNPGLVSYHLFSLSLSGSF